MLFPGPALFVDRPDFISGLYASLLVMNVFILVLLFVSTRWIAYVTTVRNRILGMMVLVLSFIGVYTSNYNIIDCFIALAFGIMGYVLKQNNMPIIPIILGLVLGPIFENRLRQALSTQKGDPKHIHRPPHRRKYLNIYCTDYSCKYYTIHAYT